MKEKNIKEKNKIVIATKNIGKLKEIQSILTNYEFVTLKDVNIKENIKEDGLTFEENSLKKAKQISKLLQMPCIADDSGLCIEELNGFPGVNTARFLGENATQEDKNNYLIKKMEGKKNRKAIFVCAITYFDFKMGKIIKTIGKLEGNISKEKRGENGFGFDEIFEIKDGRTLAELTDDEKNEISSRKIALEKLKNILVEM